MYFSLWRELYDKEINILQYYNRFSGSWRHNLI